MQNNRIFKNNNINNSKNYDSTSFIKTSKNMKNSNFFAFSLIELSIVLIIIGLLVAGITGGKSLIDSARERALLNEVRNYKQAFNTFYSLKDRFPGDLNNDGIIGISLNDTTSCVDRTHESYTTTSFPEYTTKAPDIYVAPFIDLSLEGLIDFKPSTTNPTAPSTSTFSCAFSFSNSNNLNISLPQSKAYKNLYWTNFITTTLTKQGMELATHTQLLTNNGDKKVFISFLDKDNQTFDIKTAQKIDKKVDDGDAYNGSIRGVCIGNSGNRYILYGNKGYNYSNGINNNYKCSSMSFEVF